MNITRILGDMLRIEDVREIVEWRLAFAAEWASRHPLRVAALAAAGIAVASWFYLRRQPPLRPWIRLTLTALRGGLFALLAVLLADPVLRVTVRQLPRPSLWLLFDGTESMAIQDRLPPDEEARLAEAAGMERPTGTDRAPESLPSRQDYVAAWLRKDKSAALEKLAKEFRLRAYLLEAPDAVRPLSLGDDEDGPDFDLLADQLGTKGRVTALGRGLEDLAQRHSSGNLQGIVMISDFDQNAGPPAIEAAARLGVPIYAVGVGPETAVDVAVDLQAPPMMKKAEQSLLAVTLRQTDLDGASATVRLSARPLEGPAGGPVLAVGSRVVPLTGRSTTVEFPFVPETVGRYEFVVEVDPLPGEVVEDNNRAARDVNIRDDYLRLMYVEYEPTWEWRFVKEVFHRDQLVGMRGFRTFLRSADPAVRATNELFLPTPAPPRSEFFATDVIFLGDNPSATISGRFCEMTREFVETFGGGLVVIAGSRFGPSQLAGTPLEDMLPVIVEGRARPAAQKSFQLRLAPDAGLVDFMGLGSDEAENRKAWDNLGPLPWYQPVTRPHPQATVLATHPTETCSDGKTLQPLIAIRRFGRGEVVYLGFNETWRLRKQYGELYYRQFWGQMIHRLGLSHALGSQKRFVVRTDSQRYESGDTAVITVEAYDANFEPLSADQLPERVIMARLQRPDGGKGAADAELVALPQVRTGLFEARVPLGGGGEYRLRVEDPLTRVESEAVFSVTTLSAERRSAVRNASLQRSLASATSGEACDLATAEESLGKISPVARAEKSVKVFPLSMTWLCLGLGLVLMIAEWSLRKGANLS